MSLSLPVIDTSSAVAYAPLFTFSWGESSIVRYCRWRDPITVGDDTWTPDEYIRWSFDSAHNGGVEDAPLNVEMPISLAPMTTAILPYPHSKINVLVEEMSPGDSDSKRELFRGRASMVSVKRGSQMGRFKVSGVKARLDGDLGISATSTCAWIFGDRAGSPCGIDLSAITESATISELYTNGKATRITLAFSGSPSLSNARWKSGYVQYDGLKIPIRRSYDDSTGRFELREIPPPDWADAEVSVVPGCDRQLATCRYWGNEDRFTAIGYSMPLRNPIFEA